MPITAEIKGYRQLSAYEQEAINKIKDAAEAVGGLLDHCLAMPPTDDGRTPDLRWLSIARDHLQQGFMAWVRSIAQPTTF
jgi:hypothetical protein